jgi:hypothetical protein
MRMGKRPPAECDLKMMKIWSSRYYIHLNETIVVHRLYGVSTSVEYIVFAEGNIEARVEKKSVYKKRNVARLYELCSVVSLILPALGKTFLITHYKNLSAPKKQAPRYVF